MSRTDAELLRSAAAGDTDAFGELVRRYGPRIRSFAASQTGSQSDAADLTQETFIEAYRSADRFDGRPDVLPWLLGIAANRCKTWARRKGPSSISLDALSSAELAGGDAHYHCSGPEDDGQMSVDLRRALMGLPEKYRLPILMRFQQGMNYSEIASALEISESAAGARLRRAKAMLRTRLAYLWERGEVAER